MSFHCMLRASNYKFLLLLQIDIKIIQLMTEDDLILYLPCYGDRLAIRDFCKRCAPVENKKNVLLERMRLKLAKSHDESDVATSPCHSLASNKAGNTYAARKERRVELSLMSAHCSSFRQVRSQKGGGTRHLKVSKELTAIELLQKGMDLYFPNGRSVLGLLEDFKFELRDFKMSTLQGTETVGEMYESSRMRLLKFFVIIDDKKSHRTEHGISETANKSAGEVIGVCDSDDDFDMSPSSKRRNSSITEMGSDSPVGVRGQVRIDSDNDSCDLPDLPSCFSSVSAKCFDLCFFFDKRQIIFSIFQNVTLCLTNSELHSLIGDVRF